MTSPLKNYWKSLEARERLVLTWGFVSVLIILFFSQLWLPLQNSLRFMEGSVRSMRVDTVWMEQMSKEYVRGSAATNAPKKRGENQSLMSVVEQTANRAGVRDAIQQIVPEQATGEVRVVLEGVKFNQWVLWIDNLYKNYGVDITQLNAEKEDEKPNIAEVRLSFKR